MANLATSAVRSVLNDAKELIHTQRGTVPDDVLDALAVRLELRLVLLDAAECPKHMREPELARGPWKKAIAILPDIKSTHSLAKPVEDAFSAKLQKNLASTMPPRPIVEIGFDDAFGHLTHLVQDGLELIGVLEYTDSQCLMVCFPTPRSECERLLKR